MMFNGIAGRIRIRAACSEHIWTLKFENREDESEKKQKLFSIESVFMAPFNDCRDIYLSINTLVISSHRFAQRPDQQDYRDKL